MSRRDLSLWTIFRLPILVTVLSLAGLVGALLDDGAADWIGAVLLASVVLVTTWALLTRRR